MAAHAWAIPVAVLAAVAPHLLEEDAEGRYEHGSHDGGPEALAPQHLTDASLLRRVSEALLPGDTVVCPEDLLVMVEVEVGRSCLETPSAPTTRRSCLVSKPRLLRRPAAAPR